MVATHQRAGSDERLPPEPVGLADRLDTAIVRLDAIRDRPVVSAAAVLGLAAMAFAAWWLGRPVDAEPVDDAIPLATTAPAAGETAGPGAGTARGLGIGAGGGAADDRDEPAPLIVHVAGAVVGPGIVELDPGARVVDAIEAAGGPSDDADIHQLNLAAPVSDGLQIRVPAVGEVVASPVGIGANPADPAGRGPGIGAPVDVNRASAQELEALPGIGPSLAAAIVDWRTEHGPFSSVESLESVPGIGPAKSAALADHVTL